MQQNILLKNYSWNKVLSEYINSDSYRKLISNVENEYNTKTVLPSMDKVFYAMEKINFENVKVVILGQDPYPNRQHAMGLSFSVPKGESIPKSLVNIFKEYSSDLGYDIPFYGELTKWVEQGVLLLNTSLTVIEGLPGSHEHIGWSGFTDEIIKKLSIRGNVIFVLWGNHARKKADLICQDNNYIIESVHPSPLAAYRGFFGSKPFTKINNYLTNMGECEIDFKLE